jgi:D-proline reductase (dithiol) PrdB
MKLKAVKDKTYGKLYTRFPWLMRQWARKAEFMEFRSSPWTPLVRDLDDCRVALITTGGVHLNTQPPFDMDDPDGDPSFREIPRDVDRGELTITHNYYDHRDADADVNVVLPLDRLKELEAERFVGSVALRAYAFMGHIVGRHIPTLINETAPTVASKLRADGVNIAFLTPA